MPDLETALQEANEALREKEAQLATLRDELMLLEQERTGLELAIKRRGQTVSIESPTSPYWRGLGRGEAVLQVLRSFVGPVGPREIVEVLQRTGRVGDDYNLVSAALTDLKRRGLADNPERGRWVALSRNGNHQPALEAADSDEEAKTNGSQ